MYSPFIKADDVFQSHNNPLSYLCKRVGEVIVTLYHNNAAGFAAIADNDEHRYVGHFPLQMLHHSLMLNYRNSQCYCITSESDHREFHSLISKIFSILLDIVLECILEDTNHPGPTSMDVQIFSAERKTSETLILEKISQLVWKHHSSIKL